MAKKGTVTELSSIFPAEEAQKASMRVHENIAELRREFDRLKSFVDDNNSLINLVRKLPDETHHDIMVPFGQAAFFPGRMTNPNKFLVLLGEGYHAERSAKQTVEILKRRGKALETQIESLNTVMEDLKLEASFFANTAHESAEGVVEIREDYVEEAPSSTIPTPGYRKSDSAPIDVDNGEATVQDEEYARILSRMAELEKEEEDAEEANESDQDAQIENEQDKSVRRNTTDQEVVSILPAAQDVPVVSKDHPKGASQNNVVVNKDFKLPEDEKKIESPTWASNTAFTGSIVEHAYNIGANVPQQQAGSSKPVSRFKMQRK